jgi:hypothetical protein
MRTRGAGGPSPRSPSGLATNYIATSASGERGCLAEREERSNRSGSSSLPFILGWSLASDSRAAQLKSTSNALQHPFS